MLAKESPSVEKPPGGNARPEWGGLAGEMIAHGAAQVKGGLSIAERLLGKGNVNEGQ